MDSTFIDGIREENVKKYGTQVEVYAPVLLASLYSDRTHFVYELLQNAEDACERARRKGQIKKFSVRFELYPDRLELRHNGIPFDEKDVRGICGIVEAVKDKNIAQIGKFGIGFKSVYAYSTSPEIYSEDKCFSIKAYVRPYSKERRKDVQPGETLFVIPFDKEQEKQGSACSEIERRLKNLGLRTLLFLKNIEDISFRVGSIEGKYSRQSEPLGDETKTTLKYSENGRERLREHWKIFSQPFSKDKNRPIEIAYQLTFDDRSRRWRINPAREVKLFAYFPTEKETHLSFLIQGPYNTTPARDNIRGDEWNRKLIEETAEFVADSISKVKFLGLLDSGFLNALPLDTDFFTSEQTVFRPIYEKVREKLASDEPLLPTCDGSFVTVNRAFIARGRDLRVLLTGKQLDLLFERKDSEWLDENITEDRTPELREYLIEVLEIEEVYPELFARALSAEFISKQDDEWIMAFYAFLQNQRALWKDSGRSSYGISSSPGILRSKPIIRLQDGTHVSPYDDDGHPAAYLSSENQNDVGMFSNLVKDTITADFKSREFLEDLGLTEPDRVAAVLSLVLPLYKEEVSEEDNIKHVEMIVNTLQDCDGSRRRDLLDELELTPFLYAINASDHRGSYRKPNEIHLGESYTDSKDLEIFFAGNEEIWFLDARYLVYPDKKETAEQLKQIGCISGITRALRRPNSSGFVVVEDSFGWHIRGLNGFDPECQIEGLQYAMENINIERSRIIWQIAEECCQSICGEVESGSNKNYDQATKTWQYSTMGKLLKQYVWLPDSKTCSFHKPSEISLSQLPPDFDRESTQAQYISQKLEFKPSVNDELKALLEKTPDENAREIVEIVVSASPEMRERMLDALRNIRISDVGLEGEMRPLTGSTITVSPSSDELSDEFRKALAEERTPNSLEEDKTWRGPTPEQEEKLRELELKELKKIFEKPQIVQKKMKNLGFIKAGENREEELRKFMLEEYRGHCQVCDTKLDLGGGKDPYFELYHLIERRHHAGSWSSEAFNVLCLCPNCHALMKYGGRDLESITTEAEKVMKGETAPEEVSDRQGDFYVVPIMMAGKQRELFFSPFHMAKISAFLKMTRDNGI